MDQDPSSTISPRLSPCLAPPHHRVDFLLLSLLFLDPLRFTLFFLSLCSFPPSPSLSPSLLLLLILPYSRRSLRCIAPQQEQTSLRGRHGATESRWISLAPFSILRNYHGGHRARVHLAGSASSTEYVLDVTIHTDESLGGYTPRVRSSASNSPEPLISMRPPSTRCWRMISFDSFALVCDGVVIDR